MLLLCAVYFFIAVAHIAYLPNLNTTGKGQSLSHNSIFKRKPEKVSFNNLASLLQRIDKSTRQNKESVTDLLNAAISFFTLLLFFTQLWKLNPKPLTAHCPRKDYQYSYLSFRSFRI